MQTLESHQNTNDLLMQHHSQSTSTATQNSFAYTGLNQPTHHENNFETHDWRTKIKTYPSIDSTSEKFMPM